MSFSSGVSSLSSLPSLQAPQPGHSFSASWIGPLGTSSPPPKRTSPSNKFLQALDQIERAVYEAQASESRYPQSWHRLGKIKANIKLATQNRNYLFARKALGHGLYTVIKLNKKSGRKRRSATNSVKWFMDSIKAELGKDFDTFMGVNGAVTLIFVIDDTGSMSGEIQAAKDIAVAIVNQKRNEEVDYILSPFNDPETGPVTDETEAKQFQNAINALRAHAGGDCPEKTFQGILDALLIGPLNNSPLYVFTDATAKDATSENTDAVLQIAKNYGITINFFTTGLCGHSSYEPFENLASETCGQMLKLPSSSELKKLSGITGVTLAGTTCLVKGKSGSSSGKKRRSPRGSSFSYSILVDDSTEKIIISVSTERKGPSINLRDPRGASITSGKISLSKGAIYEIDHPRPGTWKLIVSGAGKHHYLIKGSSKTNVDFDYFFVMIPTSGRSSKPIPISHPLLGKKAVVILTVAGANTINKNSLSLDLISMDGRRLGTAAVTPHGSSGAHFSATFTPPSAPFKLKLKGMTKKGYSFERLSHNAVHPSHALIRVLYARNEYTIPAGGSGFVLFLVYNTGATEIFDIKVKDHLKYAAHLRRSYITVRQGRKSFFFVTFKAPSSAPRGGSDEVLATITGRTSKKTVGHVVRLMVV